MIEHANRTLIATVVFVDIVGYSKYAVSEQMQIKTRFNEIAGQALADVAQNERILLDTGDGAALCFLGDPEHALFAAHTLRDVAQDAAGFGLELRIGINLGPIKLIKDLNGQPNVIGDAINAAQRIMSFADPHQILVSRSFYELVSCLKPEYGRLFRYLGIRQDKHVRGHEVYAIDFPGSTVPTEPSSSGEVASLGKTAAMEFPRALLTQLEYSLVKYMGPIAKVLVRKTSCESKGLEQLCQRLAENIATGAQRIAFLREAASLCGILQDDAGVPSSVNTGNMNVPNTQQIAVVEHHLANYIGPLAKMLVRRAQKSCCNLTDLCIAVAQHIENEHDRRTFLAAVGQATKA